MTVKVYYRIELFTYKCNSSHKLQCNPFKSTMIFKTKACNKILSKWQQWSNLNYFLTFINTTGPLILHNLLFTDAVFQDKYGIWSILYLARWTILLVQPLNQFNPLYHLKNVRVRKFLIDFLTNICTPIQVMCQVHSFNFLRFDLIKDCKNKLQTIHHQNQPASVEQASFQ
jgi:hypothetical protein